METNIYPSFSWNPFTFVTNTVPILTAAPPASRRAHCLDSGSWQTFPNQCSLCSTQGQCHVVLPERSLAQKQTWIIFLVFRNNTTITKSPISSLKFTKSIRLFCCWWKTCRFAKMCKKYQIISYLLVGLFKKQSKLCFSNGNFQK